MIDFKTFYGMRKQREANRSAPQSVKPIVEEKKVEVHEVPKKKKVKKPENIAFLVVEEEPKPEENLEEKKNGEIVEEAVEPEITEEKKGD